MAAPTRRALRGLAAGVALGAVAFAVVDAVRPRPGPARIVDWEDIREQALGRLSPEDALARPRRGALETRYRRFAAELERPLLDFVGGMEGEFPPFQALDRFGWVDLNVGILRDALEPLADAQESLPNSKALEFGRGVLDRYLGLILGFLSRRVLGQYDPQLLGHEPAGSPGLYLVEPNIADWEEESDLPGEALRRWLILHEMTHAWQFGAHPWLRDHLNGMLRDVLSAAIDRRRSPVERLFALTTGMRDQLGVVNRVQATMSLVEGYSNLVMDVVGRQVLPEFEVLEAAHQARLGEKTIFERLFWKLTGLELKLQQYVVGERFCKAIHERHGMVLLNRAWESPETLPTQAELREPERWARRMLTSKAARMPRRRRRE
ncbi:MAG: zinc-dependent metalloprotease [Candidatus Dormibacteraeota bacterium]|nr:zinc-dependent metalloprotease [Candidatus Dormibacteraeota bacterium]